MEFDAALRANPQGQQRQDFVRGWNTSGRTSPRGSATGAQVPQLEHAPPLSQPPLLATCCGMSFAASLCACAFGARASCSAQCASTPRYARGKNRRTANQTLHAMISVMTMDWKIA
jgi:hypothetical protein